ncbi:three prime repair exonuclease 2 [Culex pipiens pallens]|uniref:three prime repair exonuclease 2 n=1 Tax=Culex pipiens pallens TaxID=42434 RepID=UPI001953B1B6|nr:three prime repair exonuclease 2 [Culex pipiens pallens]
MAKLSSFVFFDLETTDIPGLKTPKITELSLIACSKLHLLQTKHGEIPRVLHKQTFCLNPQRLIHPKASEITGLYNDLLENESKFDENTAQLIVLFLERLQSPTCLVAHNGNRFDFPILKKELEALKAHLPDATYCIDSLPLFQTLDQISTQQEKIAQENEKNELADLELTAISAMEELEGKETTLSQMQKLNETTPRRDKINEHYKRALRSYLDVTPTQETKETPKKSPPRSKRQLFPDAHEGPSGADIPEPEPAAQSSSGMKPARKRFRLCDIYERSFGEPPKCAHYAEGDVKALLKCAIAHGPNFVAYAEEHCVRFSHFSGKM